MFTGIIHTCGVVQSLTEQGQVARLTIDIGSWQPTGRPMAHGDSICVNGVCLTVVEQHGQHLGFDVVRETLDRSTLGRLKPGHNVNLESALTPATPLGGHFLQGHVDGTARVTAVQSDSSDRRVTFEPDPIDRSEPGTAPIDAAMDAIIPKGSISIDGVSLTVATVHDHTFEVALIPVTLENTTMGRLQTGDAVNIELDIISKTVVHWLARQQNR